MTALTSTPRRLSISPMMRRVMRAIVVHAPVLALAGAITIPFSQVRALQARRPPTASATQVVRDSGTTSYEVAGIRVIHRYVTANEVVAANIYLLGGTRQLTPGTAGIEQFLLEVSGHGTRRYPRDTLRRRMAALGSEIDVAASTDWTRIGLRATKNTFDSTWTMLADRLVAPSLDSGAVELVRAQILAAVRQRRDDPDALLSYLADSVAYVGHAYAIDPIGTEQSVASITRADLRRYQAEQISTSRLLVVIVGQVDRARVERLVRTTLGTLPRGQYTWTEPPEPPIRGDALVMEQRQLPTNYILGFFHGPSSANARDYSALRVATAVLSGRLFGEIRSRRNLTYAVSAPFLERARSAGGIYVTTVSPDLTLGLIRKEIEVLQEEIISRQGVSELVQQFITEYFLNNETNAAQADFLARAQVYQGDYRLADRFVDDLRNVGPEDIRRVARTYLRDGRFAYVGDTTKISRAELAKFQE
jgi:zinc protease